jgi:signal peptidase
MKNTIKVVTKILNYFLTALLCFSVVLLSLTFFPGKKIFQTYRVVSGSMSPKIPVGSVVVVKKSEPSSIKVGDIINYKLKSDPSSTVTHRIVAVENGQNSISFKTKGDANESEDLDPVTSDQINGKVIFSLPFLGYLSVWLKTPLGFIILIICPAILIVFNEIISLNKAIEDSIIKKYKIKTNILIPFIFLGGIFINKPTNAYFFKTISVNNNVFSTGYWEPPATQITTNSFLINQRPFEIRYSIDYTDNLDYVQLCYSQNMSADYLCPNTEEFKSKDGYFKISSLDDGLYNFYTLSNTVDGKTEPNDLLSKIYPVEIDTTPPTSNINYSLLPVNQWSGGNLLINGDFEQGMTGWTGVGIGEHHLANTDGSDVFMLGFKDTNPQPLSFDGVSQIITLPSNIPVNFSFKYKLYSEEISEFSKFVVQIRGLDNAVLENILLDGNQAGEDLYDTGWKQLSRSLSGYANRTVKLWFGIINSAFDNLKHTWVYLDDIKISPIDTRIGETVTPVVDSHDLGTGILDQSTLPPLNEGENNLNFGATDAATNSEKKENINIIVQPKLVLNKINLISGQQSVELFNNSSNNYSGNLYLENSIGVTLPLNSVNIGSTEIYLAEYSEILFKIDYLHDTVYLKSDSTVFDQTTFENSQNYTIWQRSVTGLGNWIFTGDAIDHEIDVSINYRKISHKLSLSIFNISKNVESLNYEIVYRSGVKEKGIYGSIDHDNIKDGLIERDFYFGTCSTGGACTPDPSVGNTVTLTLNEGGAEPKRELFNKTFTIQP